MALRLCNCRLKPEYRDKLTVLKEISILYALLDLFYQGGGTNYVKYIMRERAVEYPKIEKLMAEGYVFNNYVGIKEGVPLDEAGEHRVRHYKQNMRKNFQNQFLRLHATDIAKEYAEVLEPIAETMETVLEVIGGKLNLQTSRNEGPLKLREANEKLFVMYARPIREELDRQVSEIQLLGGVVPFGKYRVVSLKFQI